MEKLIHGGLVGLFFWLLTVILAFGNGEVDWRRALQGLLLFVSAGALGDFLFF